MNTGLNAYSLEDKIALVTGALGHKNSAILEVVRSKILKPLNYGKQKYNKIVC